MSNVIDPKTGFPVVTRADLNAHSEQALVQLIYVGTANDMIGSAMTNLDAALNTTQSVLNLLQALQNLQNNITVKSKSAFPFLFSSGGTIGINNGIPRVGNGLGPGGSMDASAFSQAYQKAASAYFGKPIDPQFVFANADASGFSDFLTTLQNIKTNLQTEINILTQQTPAASQNDPGTLLFNLKKVLQDLPTDFSFATVEKWALDNFNQHKSTGTFQAGQLANDTTIAITSAENLNDTQKEKVQRFLFIFQQYYQSAAAVLSAMHQAINQMAQKISQ